MDAEPYATRGYYGTIGMAASQGGEHEHFSADTWIQRDICDKEPYPFADKQIDFAICSHTLEDVRDPLWVCSEMQRIAKRGYIEVPSRLIESCRGQESPNLCGLSHHRWLIDIDQQGSSIGFTMKYHMIHSHWRFSLSAKTARTLSEERRIACLFWENSFHVSEVTIHGLDRIAKELERFVRSVQPYPESLLRLDRMFGILRRQLARSGRYRRMLDRG